MHKIKIFSLLAIIASIFIGGCKDNNVTPPITETNIRLVATYSTNASTNGVYVYTNPNNFKNYAVIADGSNGIQIIDITAPNNPDSVSSFSTGGSANDVFVANINSSVYAFVSDYNNGLVIVDITNVFNPQSVGIVQGVYMGTSYIDAANKIAYVGFSGGSVNIYDISQLPGTVTFLASTGSNCNGIFVSGGRMYLANGPIGFSIYDVSNPSAPALLSITNTTGIASRVIVTQSYAYLADSYNGTLIFNVSNPSAPTLLSRIAPNGQILGVAVNNNTLYTADNGYGAESINISNPSSPSQNGNIKLNSSASNIFYFGGYLYLAAAEGGMAVLQPAN